MTPETPAALPTAHTPLPWAVRFMNSLPDSNGRYYTSWTLSWRGGAFKIAMSPNYTDDLRAENEANAALIVRAVNSYSDMVNAMELAVKRLGELNRDDLHGIRFVLATALARAKEQTPT